MTQTDMPSVALALGAGGARGLAHVHALQALDDLGIRPVAIAGTSIGAIMGAAYASGMSGTDIESYVRDRFDNKLQLMADALRVRPETVEQFLADGGPRLGELNLERILRVFLPEQIPEDFADLAIPLRVIATDYYAEEDAVIDQGALRPAIAASAAIPAVFLPVEIDGRFLVDGGMTNPAPFDTLQGLADLIIAVDVSGGTYGAPDKRPRKTDALYAASQLMQKSIVLAKAEAYQVDILIRPPVASFRVLDFLKSDVVIEATRGVREEVTAAIDHVVSTTLSRPGTGRAERIRRIRSGWN